MAKGKKRSSSSHDRTETQADEAEQRAAAGDLVRVTPAKLVQDLLKKAKRVKGQVGELVDDMAGDIAKAAENKFLHRGAFALAKRIDNMEPPKAKEFMAHFKYYLDVGFIQKKMDDVERLPLGDGGPGEEAEAPKKTRAKKGEKPGTAVKSDFGKKLRVVQGGVTEQEQAAEAAE